MPCTVLNAENTSRNKMGKVFAHIGLTFQNVNDVVDITQDLESECQDLGIVF